jgi:glycosyltransferase involved in cell wall biosynthesis
MQDLPKIRKYYRLYFLFYPFGVRSLKLSTFDLVISSSSGYAKGVHTSRDAVHVCYCHTPMRWVWSFDNYSQREDMGSMKRLVLKGLIRGLRVWDEDAARQPDHFIANSKAVAARILRAYGRHAEVIHPPIDLGRFRPSAEQGDYYLVLARLVSYKRIDLAVQACTLLGRRLLVIGDGPDHERLAALAGPTVSFLGRLSDEEVEYYASRCLALLFPGDEDFGMAPLEIAAAGRPTIAYRAGGAVETIVEGVTGMFFDQQEPESLAMAIEQFEQVEWSGQAPRRHAETFGVDVFQARISAFLDRIGVNLRDSTLPFPLLVGGAGSNVEEKLLA